MEHYDFTFGRGRQPVWQQTPPAVRRRCFGVDYVRVEGMQGGELFLTQQGWRLADLLRPRVWFSHERYRHAGHALEGATGAVYSMPVRTRAGVEAALVVKFCRFAEPVTVVGIDGDEGGRGTDFLSPFEELGHLCALRRTLGKGFLRTKTPLAIYCPPARFSEWALGRSSHRQWRYVLALEKDQGMSPYAPVRYEWDRLYILLYWWMDGMNAQEACQRGLIDAETMSGLARLVQDALHGRGFQVLDHKPSHVIVRQDRKRGGLVSCQGQPLCGLVDYELLYPLKAPC